MQSFIKLMEKFFNIIPKVNSRFTVRFTVVSLLALMCSIVASISVALQYYYSTAQLQEHVLQEFEQALVQTKDALSENDEQAKLLVDLLAIYPNIENQPEAVKLHTFTEMMAINPVVFGLYIATPNGRFFEVVNLNAAGAREQYYADNKDTWLSVTIDPAKKQNKQILTYYNQQLEVTNIVEKPNTYNPLVRPWFLQAKQHTTRGEPYLFQFSQLPGITYSRKLADNKGVIALDISLSSLSQNLAKHASTFAGEAYLIKRNGELIAQYDESTEQNLKSTITPLILSPSERQYINSLHTINISNGADWQPIDFSLSGVPKGYAVDVLKLIHEKIGLKANFVNGFTWQEFTQQFKNQELTILNAVYDTAHNRELGLLSAPYGDLPLGLLTKSDNHYDALSQLHSKKLAVAHGFSIVEEIQKSHPQINLVRFTKSHEMLELVSSGKVDAALDSALTMNDLVSEFAIDNLSVTRDINLGAVNIDTQLRLLIQSDHQQLLPIINKAITQLKPQLATLEKKWLFNEKNNVTERVLPYIHEIDNIAAPPLDTLIKIKYEGIKKRLFFGELETGLANNQLLVLAIDEKTLFSSVYKSITKSSLITLGVIIILLPLTYLCASPVTATFDMLLLQAQHIAKRHYDVVKVTPSNIIEVKRLSLAIKKMSNHLHRHEISQRNLIDSMVKLIAQAIDEKSPYTGGHCNRVPELGEMLLKAACQSDSKNFKDFNITSPQQWREFKTAAWLHDCGKITTPEHIVDKGSKLECIYNRIHEIRMRFEVLHRDYEIEYLNHVILAPEQQQQLHSKKCAKQMQLQTDFAFIANANIGSEFMPAHHQNKIKTLAKFTWQRHFDDQLGLSPIEELNRPPEQNTLPVTEFLLDDKQQHITFRRKEYSLPDKLKIDMVIPKYKANRGEIYNLCIPKGTLTPEDRFKINEHIISTIKILDQIPFPPELENVPRIASTHHETMRGDGYPRKLKGEELSIPERILALADVFEALTASDRPYKKAKKLSEALNILHQMAIERHIDITLFRLFIRSKVYLDYANKFLPKVQIDEIDENKYLS
ncbi:transporter substrate-binding domain-containing protein [Pseudoalteromonas sp. MMG010]|uniref:HD domain-containing phosphohydrolase n=1 Tax=Pseudoalteromonas sp. MMG010 TaxID=2822685 RepID=UPI001B3A5532|nr:HD domain-containing phosphohydrolase [Pseudoalteromonas sp. MMG010]MBQ4833942.1 transporter substrate-binding domain-containing protein [Pseudoalteromonas sp. MMG010]